MSAFFALLAALSLGGCGLCAAQSSCYREQGDHARAQLMAGSAVGLVMSAVICGVTAWIVN